MELSWQVLQGDTSQDQKKGNWPTFPYEGQGTVSSVVTLTLARKEPGSTRHWTGPFKSFKAVKYGHKLQWQASSLPQSPKTLKGGRLEPCRALHAEGCCIRDNFSLTGVQGILMPEEPGYIEMFYMNWVSFS